MRLSELLDYDNIVIQCHDNPDADAIASGYAIHTYLTENGKKATFVYGGHYLIRKSNLVLMVNELHIPVEHVHSIPETELLVTVDCQYGESNVTHFEAKRVAVIDHHQISGELPPMSEVRSNLGSCSTLLWRMLKDEHFDVNSRQNLATALYYGLYTDTNGFVEVSHPLDRDLRDEAVFSQAMITKFRNANLSLEELEIAGMALIGYDYNEKYRFAVIKTKPCDPNILGIISDLILEVDAVDTCLVYSMLSIGIKFSTRSCIKEVKASELAEVISKGIGSGGGHLEKAGGFIQFELLRPEYESYCEQKKIPHLAGRDSEEFAPDLMVVHGLLEKRMEDYFDRCEIIYAKNHDIAMQDMTSYKSRRLPIGYLKASELFPAGTLITIRTMQEDLDITIEENTVLLIGLQGEVYPDREDCFLRHYAVTDQPYAPKLEYTPIIKNNRDGCTVSLLEKAKTCIPKDEVVVKARRLTNTVKVFTEWDDSKYMRGDAGDYLVIRGESTHDILIYERANFERFYEPLEAPEESAMKAVIFDLDGTLLDSLTDLRYAVNYALAKEGLPERTMDEMRLFVGNGVYKLMERAVPGGTEHPKFQEMFQNFLEYYEAHGMEHTKPYPDVIDMLDQLKQRGFRLAIVSNKRDSAVQVYYERFFRDYVEAAIGESERVAKKPAPDAVYEALRQLGVDRDRAVYVGDSEVDLQTAENAGIEGISVAWGFRKREELLVEGAKQIIDSPRELLVVLEHCFKK